MFAVLWVARLALMRGIMTFEAFCIVLCDDELKMCKEESSILEKFRSW